MSDYTYTLWSNEQGVTRDDGRGIPKSTLGSPWTHFIAECVKEGLLTQQDATNGDMPQPDEVFLFTYVPEPIPLDIIKASARMEVDTAAERARDRYITAGSGQAMIYLEKAEEAADYAAAGYPADLSTYPFIAAEVAATGQTNQEAADMILSLKSGWITKGAQIEQVRLTGKVGILVATDVEAVNAASEYAVAALDVI